MTQYKIQGPCDNSLPRSVNNTDPTSSNSPPNDILVDIFWSDVQIGKGTIKTGISKEIRQNVYVTHVFEENKNKVLGNAGGEIPVLSQVQEGKSVSWPTREVQLRSKDSILLKKRKPNSGKEQADKKRENKKIKMTSFDDEKASKGSR